MAATVAARGLGGNPIILDGKAGYYDALAGQPEIAFDLGTGSDVRVMAVGQKKYPCCYLLQRIIDQVKALVSAHGIAPDAVADITRSEEHTSELQSLMRISYAVFCLKKKTKKPKLK